MKKLLFSLSLLASLATFAGESTVEATAQVFGVLPITSAAEDVIVSVPWVAASNTDTNYISVAEIIKTANLTPEDTIRVWNPGNSNGVFQVWKLDSNYQWVAGKTIDATGVKEGVASTNVFLKHGDAIILHRQNPGTQAAPNTFYVFGQYKAFAGESMTCAKGTYEVPAYTLIAPPNTSDIDINEGITWTGITDDDMIKLSTGEMALGDVDQNAWGEWTIVNKKNTWVSSTLTIKAGTGAWVISNGGTITATWKNND